MTSLVPKRGGSERVVVYIDDKRAFDVAAELADREGLRVGEPLSTETVETLLTMDAPYRARERALKLIALRDRSRHEVGSRLEQAGFSSEVADRTVDWLQGLGYLDDDRFAARYAAAKLSSGWGERRIAAELARLGLERRVVQEALGAAGACGPSEGDVQPGKDVVLALSRRRFAGQFAVDPEGAARRLTGFLARRGFDWDTIHAVVRTLGARSSRGAGGDGGKAATFLTPSFSRL